jgi:flagellar hook-length control protein FliK
VTRDALESSSPKLREMLGAQGFGQVSVDISQRSFQDRTPQSRGYEAMPAVDDGAAPALTQAAASASRAASGLLDAYA